MGNARGQPWPPAPGTGSFVDILEQRRSSVGGPCALEAVGRVLWFATGVRGHGRIGRAGLELEGRPHPGAGGLHPIELLCIGLDGPPDVLLYDARNHAFGEVRTDAERVRSVALQCVGTLVQEEPHGWTVLLVGDMEKYAAAYTLPESLAFRDAGCVTMSLCMCAEWLSLAACPLGALGHDAMAVLDWPVRMQALGMVQISSRNPRR